MIQRRPLPIRLLPPRLRLSLFDRFYRTRRDRWLSLYQDAALLASSDVSMQLIPGDRLSDELAFTGSFDADLTHRVTALGRQGGTMIDVGANLGYFSLLWASYNSSNRVIAFEAAPRNLEILRGNISRNAFVERIRVVPCAAAAQPGRLLFDLGPEDQCGWGGITFEKRGGSIEVESVRVDEMVSLDEPISLLKVDTEGADALVLMGCERLLKSRSVHEIWFEQNKPRMGLLGIHPDAAQEYLESMGYVCSAHCDPSDAVVAWSALPQ